MPTVFENLTRLKTKVFDKIEIYHPTENVGFRSPKNLIGWLSLFALTAVEDQEAIINDIAAQIASEPGALSFEDIKTLVFDLSTPEALKSIINDCELNGIFNIRVDTSANQLKIINKIKESKLYFLLPYIKIDVDQNTTFECLIKNEIKFLWSKGKFAHPYRKTKAFFQEEKIKFLEATNANNNVEYGLFKYQEHLFQVVELSVLQVNELDQQETSAKIYLIEPVDSTQAILLQSIYLDIIKLVTEKGFDYQETYNLYEQYKYQMKAVNIEGHIKLKNIFDVRVKFPELAEQLITIEERLSIYNCFKDKAIGNVPFASICCREERVLNYDKDGGELKNLQDYEANETLPIIGGNIISIKYIISNPFMMVYKANAGVDYYPYMIANPLSNLQKTYTLIDNYPTKKQIIESMTADASRVSLDALDAEYSTVKIKSKVKEKNEFKEKSVIPFLPLVLSTNDKNKNYFVGGEQENHGYHLNNFFNANKFKKFKNKIKDLFENEKPLEKKSILSSTL